MKPTELDESLLTAYLDDELSHDERRLVEEQLKVNTEWKQLLSELEGVRALIRQMPKPVLSRPIANGPWNNQASILQPKIERNIASPESTQSWLSIGQLVLAASLLVGGFVSIAIMRSEKGVREMAKTASPSAASSSQVAMMENAVTNDMPTPIENPNFDNTRVMQESAGGVAMTEAVETFYFKCQSLPLKESNLQRLQRLQPSEKIDLKTDKASSAFRYSKQPPSDTSQSLFPGAAAGSASVSTAVIEFVEGRKYDICFQRSDWPAVAIELRSLGIEPPIAMPNQEALTRSSRSLQLEPQKAQALKRYPPTLVGVIGESTDWIRVVVTVEGSGIEKSASELNK